ncbi:MAG: ABC-2 family transporter protein [Halobacteriovoraceae bacterium]|nr:ABC-2 family transporter protein [Halobacteriovoraceae bacterium]
MDTLKQYLSVYAKFISTSVTEALSFRTSFALLIIMDLFFYLATISSVEIIYMHVNHIGQWSRPQLMFFISYILLLDNFHMTILSQNFWELGLSIRQGNLDFDILKPISNIFITFFRKFRPSTLVNTPLCIGLLYHYGGLLHFTWKQYILIPFFLFISFSLLALLEFFLCIMMFFTKEGNGINFLRMGFQQMSRWPDFVYQKNFRRIFTFAIPFLLIGPAPMYALFDNRWQFLGITFIFILLGYPLLHLLWNFALSKYSSASS